MALEPSKPACGACVWGNRLLRSLALASCLLCVLANTKSIAQSVGAHLPLAEQIAPPYGAKHLCSELAWACESRRSSSLSTDQQLHLAKRLSQDINRRVRPVEDIRQYKKEEYWALPTVRGGDCEDVALLKKKELIARGVAPERLLMATVMSRRTGPHAVLVLRLASGDYILDSVTATVKLWHRTGYTFLKVQNPDSPETWVRVSGRGQL
ncbi:transglutaminase-like cysteine peptidase [Ovoidimarina sediminis]|uniref:transglutaminase-like cysteine peptidase n=1 Tax=Ovoidimarina sediminis TaxID=3079856 RepID=UPI002906A688|nr:transglutaminase-like cysteine peptidase [Rhodophyticola sp. MJ-SS7]MDU8945516.1 transglutaminase-like cysteine peptidase [Rhodophyticola sp. MJ-SS7]